MRLLIFQSRNYFVTGTPLGKQTVIVRVIYFKCDFTRAQNTVKYGFSGAATMGADYDATGDQVVFQPGELEKTIELNVRYDAEPEQLELVLVDLLSADGATIGMPRTHLHGIRDDDGKLAAPGNLTATRLQDGAVQLNWQDTNTIEQRHVIYRRGAPSEAWKGLREFDKDAWQVTANDTAWVDRSAKPGSAYQYMVQATSQMRGQPQEGMILMQGAQSEESNVAEVWPRK